MESRSAFALACAAAVACSSSDPAPDASWAGSLGGTIAGVEFTPADATGFLMDPMPCAQLDGYPPGTHTIAWVEFSSAPGTCALAIENACCGVRAGAITGHLAIVRSNVSGGSVAPIAPGTYDDSMHGTGDANGNVLFFWASLDRLDATCVELPGGPKEGGNGTIALDEIGPSRIRGAADLTFDDGSTLTGTFDVPICAVSDATFCAALKGGCDARACVP